MQHDAAGAAVDLGASLALFPCRHLPRLSDAASGAADAGRWAASLSNSVLLTFVSSSDKILSSISTTNHSTTSEATMSTNPLDVVDRVIGGKSSSGAKELKTDLIKIRGRTLVFKNTIYQIPNIAAIETVSFYASIPWLAILGVLFALWTLANGGIIAVIGLLIGAWSGFSLYKYWLRRMQYGLLILLNSGIEASTIIVSPDKDFIQQASLVIYDIMNDEDYSRAVNISFDQRQIQEVSIHDISSSTIVAGSTVRGDVVNTIS